MKTSRTWSEMSEIPFMYEQFNILYLVSSTPTLNILIRLLHATIDGFNKRNYLPRYIIFMPDEDFLTSLSHTNNGISYLLGLCLNWLSRQIESLLEVRIEQLCKKTPGAVSANTQLIWVKMLGRVTTSLSKSKIFMLRHKFNTALDDLANKRKQTHVMNIMSLVPRHFDYQGHISYAGKVQLWREIDLHLRRFHQDKNYLRPQVPKSMFNAKGQSPAPPPRK